MRVAERAVCYVTDRGFLFPTLASAMRVREFVSPETAEIFIFTIGVEADVLARAGDLLKDYSLHLCAMPDEFFTGIDQASLSKTYTPLGTFGRFFMERLLPETCQHIVYLDGDVWPLRDPSALICASVPSGRFAAAEDTMALRARLRVGHTARDAAQYFQSLRLRRGAGYFNAGVFAVSRATWREVAAEGYDFYLNNSGKCRHFDQSALNAVVGDRRLTLSVKWNFQTQLKVWRADRLVTPVLLHFNRNPKPWQASVEPWTGMYETYADAFARLQPIGAAPGSLSEERAQRANADFRKTYGYLKSPVISRAALALTGLRTIEASAWL